MHKVKCSVCESPLELPDDIKEGDRFTCTNCFAQLALKIINGKMQARCAVCRKEVLECPQDCETKFSEREKRGFFDVKLE